MNLLRAGAQLAIPSDTEAAAVAAPETEGTASPAAAPEDAGGLPATGPPEVALVVPERPGAVVEASGARYTKTRIAIRVTFPS